MQNETWMVEMEDGSNTKIRLFCNGKKQNLPVIICLSAMGVPANYYKPFAELLRQKNFHVVTADLRGNGESSVRVNRQNNFGFHEMLTYDWPAIIRKVREIFKTEPVYLCGHSLSGNLSALYLSKNPHQINGLIMIASCLIHHRGWNYPQNIGVLAGTQFIRVIAETLGYFPGKYMGFGALEAKGVIRDWTRTAITGTYRPTANPYDFETLLQHLPLPVLAISLEQDSWVSEQSVINLCHKMKNAAVAHHRLKASLFGKNKVDHFRWVQSSGPVVDCIANWIHASDSSFG
ncbi:MAG: alpha/beta fold hydrolase [SAR324 cluster bacterium]|nr:alpha/beta fold hydrolase [SAR324 cluster bacterium]